MSLALLLGLAACEGPRFNVDQLSRELPRGEAEVCRQAVEDKLAKRDVTPDWIREIHYETRYTTRSRTRDRIAGFQAWVFPKEGTGALVIELSESCRVRGAWAYDIADD
jgi:hypothetical protein